MASNPSLSKRTHPAGTPMPQRAPLIGATDLRVLGKLPLSALAAWCLPERRWDGLAALAAGLERSSIDRLARRITTMLGPERLTEPAGVLARRQLAYVRLDQLCFLRSHRPGGWRPTLRLEGAQHLEAALGAGRGAILWVAPTVFQWLATKRALHEAGYGVYHLSSPNHGFSTASWLGTRLLNPIRTGVEDRYLAERVTLDPDGGAQNALRRLTAVLRGNGIVSITVAAVLPVVTLRRGAAFVTRIEAPLALPPAAGRAVPALLVAGLAARLEPHALADPDQIAWRLDCIDIMPPAAPSAEMKP